LHFCNVVLTRISSDSVPNQPAREALAKLKRQVNEPSLGFGKVDAEEQRKR